MNERHLLSSIKHPFLVNMIYAFQDRDNLYLVIDMMNGGDLRYHLNRRKFFTEIESSKLVKKIIFILISRIFYLFYNNMS